MQPLLYYHILDKQLSADNQACYICQNSSEIYPQDFHSSVKLFRHIFKPVSSTRAGTVIICLPINCPIPSVTISMLQNVENSIKIYQISAGLDLIYNIYLFFFYFFYFFFFFFTSSASFNPKQQSVY